MNQFDYKMPMVIIMGIIGGTAIGSWAYQHAFVEGFTDKERKEIFKLVGTSLAVYAFYELVMTEEEFQRNVDALYNKALHSVVP